MTYLEKESNMNQSKPPSLIENLFIPTMRGILDSLYNEYMYMKNP